MFKIGDKVKGVRQCLFSVNGNKFDMFSENYIREVAEIKEDTLRLKGDIITYFYTKDFFKINIDNIRTELPEKWCVKPNKEEENKIIKKFIQSKSYGSISENCFYYYHYPFINGVGSYYYEIQLGYTEITFEDFKKYVLKESWIDKEEYKFKQQFVAKGKDCDLDMDEEYNYPHHSVTTKYMDISDVIREYPLTYEDVFKPKHELQFQEPVIIKKRKKRR